MERKVERMKIPAVYSKHYQSGEHRRPPRNPKDLNVVWVRAVPPPEAPDEPGGEGPGLREVVWAMLLCPIAGLISYCAVKTLRAWFGF